MIEDYALCNPWDWFGTFTLSKQNGDRSDLDAFRKRFMQFIRDCRKRYGHIAFIIVPELHSDGENWHMHGLLSGVPSDALRLFTCDERIPKYILDKLSDGQFVYDWPAYRSKFGFVDLEPIRNHDAAARYITKYITKSADAITAKELGCGKHLYFPSKGLSLPEKYESPPGCYPDELSNELCRGNFYAWDYGEVQWFDTKYTTER